MFAYLLQGLLVTSNRPLPGLSPHGGRAQPDLIFHAGFLPPGLDMARLCETKPAYTSPFSGPGGEPSSRMWRCPDSGLHCLQFAEGFPFVIDAAAENIWAVWPERVTFEEITAHFLGRVLAFALHLRGHACLHASAVALGGKAVLFVGQPGMGKSSMVAAFAGRGYPVLTDDVCAIRKAPDGRLLIAPGIPRVCLLPDSMEHLYGPEASRRFSLLLPQADKRVVPLGTSAAKFQVEPAQLEAIYLLAPRSSDPAAPRIEAVPGADSVVRMLSHGFMNLALDKEQSAREFRILSEAARRARVRQLVPSSDLRKLSRVCELVENDLLVSSPSHAH